MLVNSLPQYTIKQSCISLYCLTIIRCDPKGTELESNTTHIIYNKCVTWYNFYMKSVLLNILSFSGTLTRMEYFVTLLVNLTIVGALDLTSSILDNVFPPEAVLIFLIVAPMIVLWIWIGIVSAIKRIRDVGWSQYTLVLFIVPIVNIVVILLLLYIPLSHKNEKTELDISQSD